MVSAEADVTQLCRALLEHGPGQPTRIKRGMITWLEERGHGLLSERKGRVSQWYAADPAAYEGANHTWTRDTLKVSSVCVQR